MLTLERWKQIRRVDHLTLPGLSFRRGFYWAHPRFRNPANRPDLKVYDRWVRDYHAANNDFDRVNQLCHILQTTSNFIDQRDTNDRYDQAVNELHNQTITEMNRICGDQHQQAMENYITGQARPARQILINIIVVTVHGTLMPRGVLQTLATHIRSANACPGFQSANLSVRRANQINTHLTRYQTQSITLTHPPAPENVVGKVHPDMGISGGRLISYCNNLGTVNGAKCIDVVYIPDFEVSDTAGMTLRAGKQRQSGTPQRPIILINMNPSRALRERGGLETTLAHELGHAICSCGEHAADAANLMAGGDNRNGNDQLSFGQRAWFSSNPWVN
jgi:hypothetical protein